MSSEPVPTTSTQVKDLVALGRSLGDAKVNPSWDGLPFAVVPIGYTVATLPTMAKPPRAKGVVKLRDATSFIAYFNDHKNSDSRIYAKVDPPQFLGVLDEFPLGDPVAATAPAWREFRIAFAIPYSPEWMTWNGNNKQAKTQVEFAEFIQDNAADVTDPVAGSLMEMALDFQTFENGSLASAVRLQNGNMQFAIRQETTVKEGIIVPEFLKLKMAVFERGPQYEFRARLRYRTSSGLKFWYELERPHKVIETAFQETWLAIATGTKLGILLGSPE